MAESKASTGQPRWRTKLHPFFVSVAEHNKKIVQLSRTGRESDRQESQRMIRNPPAELVEEARRLGDERARSGIKSSMSATKLFAVDDRYPATPEMSDEQFMLAWLAWNKYGKTLKQLLEEDRAGVKQSSERLVTIRQEYNHWRYDKQDPEKLKFKFDREHQLLIMMGLDFGIDSLTAEELADCFNELCACGAWHSPENLRKLRTRTKQFLTAAGAQVESDS
jgi:hypothetical protein